MIAQERPTLYIPIEIKVRELDSQLLLATRASAIGVRSYVGSKRRIHEVIRSKARAGGVLLYKGTHHANYMKWLSSRVDAIAVLDQEMSPNIRDLENRIPHRFFQGTQQLVDRYFAVGRRAYRAAKTSLIELKGDIELTGWPRIDLWGDTGRNLYHQRTQSIRNRFGRFLLFASDFSVTSETKMHSRLNDASLDSKHLVQVPIERRHPRATYRDFLTTVEALRVWDADSRVPTIIVRPHPTEDITGWRSTLRGLSKTIVAFEGDIAPWISASQGVIHRGCTTAIQAHLTQVPTFHLTPSATDLEPWLPYYISDFEVDRDHPPVKGLARVLPEDARIRGKALLEDSIHVPAEGAATIIARSLAELAQTAEPRFVQLPVGQRLTGTTVRLSMFGATALHSLMRDRAATVPVSRKMEGGIGRVDVIPAIEAFGFCGTSVRLVHSNLWEINP